MRTRVQEWLGLCIVALIFAANLFAGNDIRLVEAAKSQNAEAARVLLKQHADVNAQIDGATALHWAAHWDDLQTADLLIQSGANVNSANDLGVTPLALACMNRNAVMVEKLLTAGANPNAATTAGESVLMTAARTGNVDVVKALLAHGANVNTKGTSREQTPLMWAVAEQHPDVVRILLEHGADVHARSRENSLLVYTGEPSVAAGRNAASMVRTVEKGGSTPLLFAARTGDLESARLLVAAGANVNDAAPDGNSALVLASHSGHGKLAAFLLDKDANPNAAGAGYSALHAAVLRDDLDLVKSLLAHGANPNATISQGTESIREGKDFVLPSALVGATPFFLAAKLVEVDIMRVLRQSGADPHLATKDGTTPLLAAAGVGWDVGADRRGAPYLDPITAQDKQLTLDAVKLAIELGADVNAVNQAGDTALHGTAAKGFDSVLQLLSDKGAALNVKNKRGQTPLALTRDAGAGAARGQPELRSTAELLRKLGAK